MLDRVAGSSARFSIQGRAAQKSHTARALASARAISAGSPPTDRPHSSAAIQSSTQSIDGVLMVSPWKMPSMSLPLEVRRKTLGRGRSGGEGLQPLDGAGPEHQDAVRGLAAHDLLPGEGGHVQAVPGQRLGERGRGRVADREPLAIPPGLSNEAGTRTPEGGAVPGEHHVAVPVEGREVHDAPVVGAVDPGVEPELLDGVRDPALAEALPGHHLDGALPQHGPHGHLDGAGVGGGGRCRRGGCRGPPGPRA